MSVFRALSHRAFALLWGGQSISRIGDFLYQVALAWWVLEKTGSPAAMGTVFVFSFTPMLIFLLLGGIAVDRFPRLTLMVSSDLLRGLVVGVVAFLAFTKRLEIWHVYAASLLFGFVDAFFQPAFVAVVPELTPFEALTSANSLNSLSMQFGRVAGPAIGGLLVGLGGTPLAFAINSASFFVSAAFLAPLLRSPANRRRTRRSDSSAEVAAGPESADPAGQPTGDEAAPDGGILREIGAGFTTVLGTPWLWITILVFAVTNVTLAGPYNITLPFLVSDNWHAGPETLGLLYAIFPIGYAVTSFFLGRLPRIRHRGWIGYLTTALAGLCLLVIGLPVPLSIVLVAAFVNGAALETFSLIWTNLLQEKIPPERLGRVASIDALGSYALLPVGGALTGWVTGQIGAPLVLVLGGGITVLMCLLPLLHPAIRGLD